MMSFLKKLSYFLLISSCTFDSGQPRQQSQQGGQIDSNAGSFDPNMLLNHFKVVNATQPISINQNYQIQGQATQYFNKQLTLIVSPGINPTNFMLEPAGILEPQIGYVVFTNDYALNQTFIDLMSSLVALGHRVLVLNLSANQSENSITEYLQTLLPLLQKSYSMIGTIFLGLKQGGCLALKYATNQSAIGGVINYGCPVATLIKYPLKIKTLHLFDANDPSFTLADQNTLTSFLKPYSTSKFKILPGNGAADFTGNAGQKAPFAEVQNFKNALVGWQ